jgi:hypothetical protein
MLDEWLATAHDYLLGNGRNGTYGYDELLHEYAKVQKTLTETGLIRAKE